MSGKELAGAVAVVTDASSGIGAATAVRLAAEGCAVALIGRRQRRLEDLADFIVAGGGTAAVIEADLTDPDRAADAVHSTLDRFDRLDVLVNNAGIMLLGSALHTTVEEWDRMVALNVRALLYITHAALPYLIDAAATSPRRVADVVNVSSTAGHVARPSSSVYNLTKFGLNGFSESLRQELLVERVRVSVVAPGTGDIEPDGIGPPQSEDVADAIAYIVTRNRRVAVNELLVRAGDQT